MSTYCLATYVSDRGPRAALVVGEMLYDLAEITERERYNTTLAVLQNWREAKSLLERIAATANASPGFKLFSVTLLAPILYPPTIYCAGANYSDHAANMARIQNLPIDPDPHELGLNPWHFLKPSHCVVATDATVETRSQKLDWEAELAVVIGIGGKNIPLERALDHVAALTIANDLSQRDLMRRNGVSEKSPFNLDWVGHKCFDGSCPLGPWLVPIDQVADVQNLSIRLWVNDVLKQDSNTSRMLFSAAEQIAFLSTRLTLQPGDVILTGTPAGVGTERGEFLKQGDTIRIEIEGLGELITHIG